MCSSPRPKSLLFLESTYSWREILDYFSLMEICEDCNLHIANIYGPLKKEGDKWYVKRKTPSGKFEWIMFFGLSQIFKIKVCPNCGIRNLLNFEHAIFGSFKELEAGLLESKKFLESQGTKVFFADYSEPETLSHKN